MKKSYLDFRKALAKDKSYAKKFAACKTIEALIAAAALDDYIFTADDIKNYTELLPEELELMAGGRSRKKNSTIAYSTYFVTSSTIVG